MFELPNTSARDFLARVRGSLKEFHNVLLIAAVLAFLMSITGGLLGSLLYNTNSIVWILLALLIIILIATYGLWRLMEPPNSFKQSAYFKLLLNAQRESILLPPSWTYAPLYTATHIYEAFKKRNLWPKRLLASSDDFGSNRFLEDLIVYLVLKWFLGTSTLLSRRILGMKFRQLGPQDFSKGLGRDNEVVKLAIQIRPDGLDEISSFQFGGDIPNDFQIRSLKQAALEKIGENGIGISLSNNYCSITLIVYPTGLGRRPILRTGPAPILDGMPIDAIDEEYYLKQLEHIWYEPFILECRIRYSRLKLLLRPAKTQHYIAYISAMADEFKTYFDWETNADRAITFREKEMYELLKVIRSEVGQLNERLNRQGDKHDKST